jgi:hypothetical protein
MCRIKQYYSVKQTKLKGLYCNRTIQHQNVKRGKESTQESILETRSPFDCTFHNTKIKKANQKHNNIKIRDCIGRVL